MGLFSGWAALEGAAAGAWGSLGSYGTGNKRRGIAGNAEGTWVKSWVMIGLASIEGVLAIARVLRV